MSGARPLLTVQGIYYLLTGLWPLVSIHTFIWVTGPKTDNIETGREGDHWLVFTVGALIVAIALSLLTAAWRREYTWSVAVVAIGAILGLTAIDVIYVAREVIPPIYLVDAVAEIALLAWWITVLARGAWNSMTLARDEGRAAR